MRNYLPTLPPLSADLFRVLFVIIIICYFFVTVCAFCGVFNHSWDDMDRDGIILFCCCSGVCLLACASACTWCACVLVRMACVCVLVFVCELLFIK